MIATSAVTAHKPTTALTTHCRIFAEGTSSLLRRGDSPPAQVQCPCQLCDVVKVPNLSPLSCYWAVTSTLIGITWKSLTSVEDCLSRTCSSQSETEGCPDAQFTSRHLRHFLLDSN